MSTLNLILWLQRGGLYKRGPSRSNNPDFLKKRQPPLRNTNENHSVEEVLEELPSGVFQEDTLSFQVHEKFSSAEVLQDEVQLSPGLEGVHQVHDEGVLATTGRFRNRRQVNTLSNVRGPTLTASRMFLSALVWAVSFWLRTMEALRSTFMAKMVPASWPVTLRTWNTFP